MMEIRGTSRKMELHKVGNESLSKKEQMEKAYKKEILPAFHNLRVNLLALHQEIFNNDEDIANFVVQYIKSQKVKKGFSRPSVEDVDPKDREKKNIAYFSKHKFNFAFWGRLKSHLDQANIFNGSDGQGEVVKKILSEHLEDIKSTYFFIYNRFRKYVENIAIAASQYKNISEEGRKVIALDCLENTINSFNPNLEGGAKLTTSLTQNIHRALKTENNGDKRSKTAEDIKVAAYGSEYYAKNEQLPSPEEISVATGVKLEKVNEYITKWVLGRNERSATSAGIEEDWHAQESITEILGLSAKQQTPEQIAISKNSSAVLKKIIKEMKENERLLNDKEKAILRKRLLPIDGDRRATLQEIADQFSISRERIRQLEVGLIGKIRKRFKQYNINKISDII